MLALLQTMETSKTTLYGNKNVDFTAQRQTDSRSSSRFRKLCGTRYLTDECLVFYPFFCITFVLLTSTSALYGCKIHVFTYLLSSQCVSPTRKSREKRTLNITPGGEEERELCRRQTRFKDNLMLAHCLSLMAVTFSYQIASGIDASATSIPNLLFAISSILGSTSTTRQPFVRLKRVLPGLHYWSAIS